MLRRTRCLRTHDIAGAKRYTTQGFSNTSRRSGYDDTIHNLKIGAHTRVIFQGFTGKQATANAQESLAWGTNIVGGTNPKKAGTSHLGLPVVGTVREAMKELKPDATGIYVAAHQAAAAIEEAIEAEVPLIVAVAEHIPLHEIMRVFEHDEDTEAIIIVGELGGTSEEEAADWIRDYRKRVRDPKPIAAVVGGFQAAPGRIMGHAGAWTGLGEGTAEEKYKALESAGVTMVDHPAKFGEVMKEVLANSGRNVKKIERSAAQAQQRRSYHTTSRFSRRSNTVFSQQVRSLHINAQQSADLLKSYNIEISPPPSTTPESNHFLGITVDRTARSPCIIAAPTALESQLPHRVRRFPFDYRSGPSPKPSPPPYPTSNSTPHPPPPKRKPPPSSPPSGRSTVKKKPSPPPSPFLSPTTTPPSPSTTPTSSSTTQPSHPQTATPPSTPSATPHL
ncbi:hypothetical protein GRF29_154g1287806 [Pseudopithomyces chartarum]|uniref:CoA-binding domain-containing protein n=1 Tax=Pseudopithomyces chartarum TaxID=1892770 RepID=A0AAN6RF18_9PLEO|nr:hypothetical protein GRF29_154g1287806 [Pseudopithomyces chartarum]